MGLALCHWIGCVLPHNKRAVRDIPNGPFVNADDYLDLVLNFQRFFAELFQHFFQFQ